MLRRLLVPFDADDDEVPFGHDDSTTRKHFAGLQVDSCPWRSTSDRLEFWSSIECALVAVEMRLNLKPGIGIDRPILGLPDGRVLSVPLSWFPRLFRATPEQLKNWRLIGDGEGIHWTEVDEDLSVIGLLRGSPAPPMSGT
jgi:hypothetical protein